METTESKNCKIIHKAHDNSINQIIKSVDYGYSKNEDLFKIKAPKCIINLTYSNREYDKKTKLENLEKWRGGYVDKNIITMFSPNFKKMPFTPKSFFFHEINHIFYVELVGNYHPIWFSEGMATYLMKTYKFNKKTWKEYFKAIKKPEQFLYHRYIKKRHFKDGHIFYILSSLTYEYLDKTFGTKKNLKMLKDFSKDTSKANFENLLIKHFKQSKKEIVQNAIK